MAHQKRFAMRRWKVGLGLKGCYHLWDMEDEEEAARKRLLRLFGTVVDKVE